MSAFLHQDSEKQIRENIDYWMDTMLGYLRDPDLDDAGKVYYNHFLSGVKRAKKSIEDGGLPMARAEFMALIREFIDLTKRKATIPAHAIQLAGFLSCVTAE